MITLIAAVAKNGVIGHQGEIPWYLPEDFKHFKRVTDGHVIIMGSSTWESLPTKPLPNRLNIILSSKPQKDTETVRWVTNIPDALKIAKDNQIFVIGGAKVYAQTIKLADRLLISEVEMEPDGDTFFPKFGKEWTLLQEDRRDGFSIKEYEKTS